LTWGFLQLWIPQAGLLCSRGILEGLTFAHEILMFKFMAQLKPRIEWNGLSLQSDLISIMIPNCLYALHTRQATQIT
jgi:hypothetical protein